MHRRIAVLAGAALAAAAVAAPAGAQAPPAPQTLTLTEPANGGSFNIVDNAPRSRGRGEHTRFSSKDAIVITSPLLDASRKRAGRLRAACFVSKPGTFRTVEVDCVGVYALSTGNLYVAITFKLSDPTASGTVVAGTGAYAGLHGTWTSTQHRDDSSTDVFMLTP
jgi:hypothetical protein